MTLVDPSDVAKHTAHIESLVKPHRRTTIVRSVANPNYPDEHGRSPYGPNSQQSSHYNLGLSVMGIIKELEVDEDEYHPLDFVPDPAAVGLYGRRGRHLENTTTVRTPHTRKIFYPNSKRIRRVTVFHTVDDAPGCHPIESMADLLAFNQVPFNPELDDLPSSRRPSWIVDLLPLPSPVLPRVYNEYTPDKEGFLVLSREATAVHPAAERALPLYQEPSFQAIQQCRILGIPDPEPTSG